MSLLRLPRSAVRSQPSGRKAPSRSIIAATRETLALVLDENAPLLDSDHDIDDVILRLRGHLMELGHASLGRSRPELDAALAAARKSSEADVPTQYLDMRKHLRKLATAVATVVVELAVADRVCGHLVECPPATAQDCEAAKIRLHQPEIGCSELCNGVLIFEDTGCLLPTGDVVEPRRPLPREAVTA
ncbi:DUF5999 family protein (plasmid) [Streptomyces sp. AM 4-1-1]|nr:DUF5999 family protein [Streptomyces sp. AM 4-1-1]WEH37881.1 DUF5999 family protein [Streptomyces sp. AM 4-1-1]